MRKIALIGFALVAAQLCHAQSQTPTIKGHTLGESFQQFIASSTDVTRQQIQNCIASHGEGRHGITDFKCQDFLKVAQLGSANGSFECQLAMYEIGVCRDFRGRVTFENGKLVRIHLEVTDQDWESVLSSATEKFGKPLETHVVTSQNGYGAKFDLQTASWSAANYVVMAFEKVNIPYNTKVFVELDLVDRQYWERQNQKKASALD